jgi:hypothetical protein
VGTPVKARNYHNPNGHVILFDRSSVVFSDHAIIPKMVKSEEYIEFVSVSLCIDFDMPKT